MKEHQHIEWKASWRDDYLRWVCGFANAEGGVLVIGRDDGGAVVGLVDVRRLLEELPNKVRDLLGIMVDVNLRTEVGREYLEISVPAYPNPISYKGEYYYRSGSTNQTLKGAALDRFLLRRQGRHWDGVPVPGFGVADLSPVALPTVHHRQTSAGTMACGWSCRSWQSRRRLRGRLPKKLPTKLPKNKSSHCCVSSLRSPVDCCRSASASARMASSTTWTS